MMHSQGIPPRTLVFQNAHVNGVRLAYERAGQGFPMLLIHGFPRDRRLWRKLVPLLVHRFDTVALDRRGYGESDRPPDPAAYDNRTMAEDVLELARHLEWDRCVVVGHDLGQPVAQRLAADHPDLVAAAVFLDGLPQGAAYERARDPSGRTWYFDFFRQRGVAEQLIGQNPRLFFSLFLARSQHLTPEEHEAFLEPFCRSGSVEAVLSDYRHMLEDDRLYWERWLSSGGKIETPVCVLWSTNGPVASAPILELWRGFADNLRGAEIADTGHYLQEEQPERVARRILNFADEIRLP
jgi:pimeloyl-ACP methyl ester carboxylesterase